MAIPQELLGRLRFETIGSTNQVLIALVRQAIAWLDGNGLTLLADVHEGPVPASLTATRAIPGHLVGQAKQDFIQSLDDLWPNARLSSVPRDGHLLAVQMERQPRADAQLTQISIPNEVLIRLQRDGVGAVSQLVISLARYAIRRLDNEKLSLDVAAESAAQPISTDEPNAKQSTGGFNGAPQAAEGMTVAALMNALSKLPKDAYVAFGEGDRRWWDIDRVELANDHACQRPPGRQKIPTEQGAAVVLLRGSPSDVYEFDASEIDDIGD
ncbi:hypothetical protein [Dyella japonica]|uniref:Uncharacterized protein n=1 Tax=Dyella japonica DSM 16301 TaxID=1440762 RepID=A0A0G9H3E5_9GAMM|nr:hypothetical protein [Dyella japonica]KLD64103.1 hypothetical protein Y882_08450 [Dyella japonica DSM 16301]